MAYCVVFLFVFSGTIIRLNDWQAGRWACLSYTMCLSNWIWISCFVWRIHLKNTQNNALLLNIIVLSGSFWFEFRLNKRINIIGQWLCTMSQSQRSRWNAIGQSLRRLGGVLPNRCEVGGIYRNTEVEKKWSRDSDPESWIIRLAGKLTALS